MTAVTTEVVTVKIAKTALFVSPITDGCSRNPAEGLVSVKREGGVPIVEQAGVGVSISNKSRVSVPIIYTDVPSLGVLLL